MHIHAYLRSYTNTNPKLTTKLCRIDNHYELFYNKKQWTNTSVKAINACQHYKYTCVLYLRRYMLTYRTMQCNDRDVPNPISSCNPFFLSKWPSFLPKALHLALASSCIKSKHIAIKDRSFISYNAHRNSFSWFV